MKDDKLTMYGELHNTPPKKKNDDVSPMERSRLHPT
jgi:hypothetical protein